VIPSKLFEFLAQERPVVLAAPNGEIRSLVEEVDVGLVIEPEQPEALAQAVKRAMDEPEEAVARARRGLEWIRAGFQRDALARRMAAFMARSAGIPT
jgi:glycosyltransferase involved in cell wall biosynthesis